jgi:hypothetical protein
VYLASVCVSRFNNLGDAQKRWVRGLGSVVLWGGITLLGALLIILSFPLVPYERLQAIIPQLESLQRYWLVAQLTLGQFSVPLMVLAALGIVIISLALLGSPRHARDVLLVQAGLLCMALSVTTGSVTKFGLKRFPELAQQVTALADRGPVAVLKVAGDELFDPILYYLGRPVRVLSPEDAGQVCDGRTLVLTRENTVRDLLQGEPVQASLLSRYMLRSTVDMILSRPGLACASRGYRRRGYLP